MSGGALHDEDLSDADSDRDDSQFVAAVKGILTQKIAVLLVFMPLAWLLKILGDLVPPLYNFVANFFSIIPLSWLISVATEALEEKVGQAGGVLLNASFGNVVEVLLSISAIRAGLVKVVQSTLVGAIFMNLLLVLGCCFFVCGVANIKKEDKKFNQNNATYALCLLSVSCTALMVPTSLAVLDEWGTQEDRTRVSRGCAIVLASMYFQWLVFNLSTHKDLFGTPTMPTLEDKDEDDDEPPPLPCTPAVSLLLLSTVIVAFHCDWLVEAIDPVCDQLGVKKAFIATVLLPIVGGFSEEVAAVSIAMKGKLDLAMGVAIGSATQIAVFVIPVAVFIGWAYDSQPPLDLDFETYQVQLLIMSLIVAMMVLQDGRCNWLKGSLLITTYVILAASFWFIHDREFKSAGEEPDVTISWFKDVLANTSNASTPLEKWQAIIDAVNKTES
eukprot:gnl/TRDRNA2_/TRDRNA2_94073_c0_seq2.p1 gnl/TRDRNA2_/TRDRNA2_94073_c0~~gnl/TRDRNA2_/TRDRNA2_94073_c0_seq2.p1  ORF type:complete len:443 (+),score=88.75 gnl/TRDRNA2_/TRDRNA2_94073_c0_seq2:114-1442(+)